MRNIKAKALRKLADIGKAITTYNPYQPPIFSSPDPENGIFFFKKIARGKPRVMTTCNRSVYQELKKHS